MKNPNGDTRTAPKDVTFKQFQQANDMHRNDVKKVMNELAVKIVNAGSRHDITKKSHEMMLYNDFRETLDHGKSFIDGEWYTLHVRTERHHLLNFCPHDVNLIDVLEMIADQVCAEKARGGGLPAVDIPEEILQKAVDNTKTLIESMIVVKEN